MKRSHLIPIIQILFAKFFLRLQLHSPALPIRQAISTQGEKGKIIVGIDSPTNPINSFDSFNSTAHNPKPYSSIKSLNDSARVLLSKVDKSLGKNSITFGSALIRAKDGKSLGRHWRQIKRLVSNSIIGNCDGIDLSINKLG